jgi:hypothetical protein
VVSKLIHADDASSLNNQDLMQIAAAVATNRTKLERLFNKTMSHKYK